MKRTAVIFGGPNLRGNTHRALIDLLEKKQIASYDRFDLDRYRIAPCKGCLACRERGTCVIRDDHPDLVEKLLAYDRLIFASPVYFNGVTAQTKCFVDRLETLFHRKMHLGTLESQVEEVWLLMTAGTTLNERIRGGIYEMFRLVALCFGNPLFDAWIIEGFDGCKEPTRIKLSR